MKYIRTNKEILYLVSEPIYADDGACEQDCYECITSKGKARYIYEEEITAKADSIEELCDEIVLIENGVEHNIVYLQEAYDKIDEYHEQDNYEPRLIGRIKVGLDKKAVAEWKENEQGLYDWILL